MVATARIWNTACSRSLLLWWLWVAGGLGSPHWPQPSPTRTWDPRGPVRGPILALVRCREQSWAEALPGSASPIERQIQSVLPCASPQIQLLLCLHCACLSEKGPLLWGRGEGEKGFCAPLLDRRMQPDERSHIPGCLQSASRSTAQHGVWGLASLLHLPSDKLWNTSTFGDLLMFHQLCYDL